MFRSGGSSSARSHSSQSYSSMPPATHLTEEDIYRISSQVLDKMEAQLEAREAREARLINRMEARFRAPVRNSIFQYVLIVNSKP